MTPGKKKFIAMQHQQAKHTHLVRCACGVSLGVYAVFQCLYCNEFFCTTCAEVHFGETIESRNGVDTSDV